MVAGLTKAGISLMGSRVLAVRGRKSGEWRTTPVNLLVHGGERYLVAPRGHVQWVRNLRASGTGELRVGRRVEAFSAVELADADKPEVLREYLRRWAWEVKYFFEDVTVDSPTEELLRIAPGFPVFRVTEVE
ncbi:nitroreductase family deazaflavin-dependent oxidoreductase [Kitasatospora sp. NPDC051170]|uniref:nitroreductase family deazaflavin-dependent oxidoreductase n=1 Tax=Kitasatospora sp. NPDC051170 TaxID=3364056 RepID=UPI0037AE99BF